MTPREELLEALLVERYRGGWLIPDPRDEDNDINTARRRRELAEAVGERERRTA